MMRARIAGAANARQHRRRANIADSAGIGNFADIGNSAGIANPADSAGLANIVNIPHPRHSQ